MKPYLPLSVFVCAGIALLTYGPIAQFADYHHFADQRTFAGIPRAADVLSNVAFGVVALWGVAYLRRAQSWGYALFVISLLLTAIGSAFYHLAPDDSRLVWDRIPIALACAGLLATTGLASSAVTRSSIWRRPALRPSSWANCAVARVSDWAAMLAFLRASEVLMRLSTTV